MQFSMRIPIDQLNSAISISIPFYAPFGGRSSSGGAESTRLNLYREMEGYVSQITRTDGHSCLLRAMCEVSANPGHEDGLMGDITNFLLTGSYSAADQTSEAS